MGSSGSKTASSSSLGSSRKGLSSKGHRGFRSYCLGTTSSGSHDSDHDEDQVCDQNKVNDSDVTYANGNGTEPNKVKPESFFRKEKSGEMPCMPSNIDLDEWHQTSIPIAASRTGSSSVNASMAHSLNPSSQIPSRFSIIPGNRSFRLSRTASLGSSRPCPVSPASLSVFDDEDEFNQQHPGPSGSTINRNDTRRCNGSLPASGFAFNLQSDSADGVCTREGLDLNLFSPRILPKTENVDTRHTDQRNGAREPVDRNVHFSRTLSVGRLRDRVLRRSALSDLAFCPLQPERESRVSPSDHTAVSTPSTSGYPPSGTSNSVFSIHDYEVETSRSREGRYQDLLEHRSNFHERRRRIRSQVRALQRLGGRFENLSGHDRSCILSGRHRNGRCMCRISNRDNTNSNDDTTNTRASISRIVMLAEALFEVLDEIHQQSVVLSSRPSISSIGSVPAPNEVVESLPIKSYTKLHKHQEDAAQCYICLVEYEDRDSMRVLPCHHEFHRTCIDKWLKEIHRVCPLCRGDICISDSQPTENSSG